MKEEPDRLLTFFLDANVIISAAWKADAEVALIWKMPAVRLVTSSYSMGEVQRNLSQIHQIERLRVLMRSVQVLDFEELPDLPECLDLPEKDRPIFAAAFHAAADHLISGDKKHFGPWFGKTIRGVRITPPTELLGALRRTLP